MKKIKQLLFTVLVTTFIFGYYQSKAQIVFDFENRDISLWGIEGDGSILIDTINGNPGSVLRVEEPATGASNFVIVHPAANGNWSLADSTDFISWDLLVHKNAGTMFSANNDLIELSGPGGYAKFTGIYSMLQDTFIHRTVALNPALWTMVSGTWTALMQSVDLIRVRTEFVDGDEYDLLDNVALSFTPIINEPEGYVCSPFDSLDGFDGWNFVNTASIASVNTFGNPPNAIKINDKSNVLSYGYAPPKFRGNFHTLNDTGTISFDVRVNTSLTTLSLPPHFIRLAGPGGQATFPITAADAAAMKNVWHSFSIPVVDSLWTITSGTWNALLNNVTVIEIALEYYNGTSETVYFDNFCIGSFTPPCHAEGGNITPATATFCAQQTYVMTATGASSHPDNIYQWQRATVSGGPYTNVTGGSGANTTSFTTGKLIAGTYYYVLKVTCPDGLTDYSNELTVNVKALPTASITAESDTIFCSGGSVVLNAPVSANRAYQWLRSGNIISGANTASYTATTSGTYKVEVTNTISGCTKSSYGIKVTTNPLPTATVTPAGPLTFCAGDSVVLQANAGAGFIYQWKKEAGYITGATQQNYTASTGGKYKIQITDSNGCTRTSDPVTVTVNCRNGIAISTNAVSVYPNPATDNMVIENIPASDYIIEVINVLGEVVLKNTNSQMFNVSTLQTGVYQIKITTADELIYHKFIKE
ncbi:MAG: T9SS type A sorting domain-containing protein [Bacteroidia bacterium]|nr:T9SS type A sorting domain-containing protein [Bacteroidia bacterium]